jgi:hypothetical protein
VIQVLAGRLGFRFTSHHYAVIAAGPWCSPRPPRPCRSPGGPSRVPIARRPLPDSPRGVSDRVPAPLSSRPFRASQTRPGRLTNLPLLGFVQFSVGANITARPCADRPVLPFIDLLPGVHSQRVAAPSVLGQPDPGSRSDRVVSHHLAGFLRHSRRSAWTLRSESRGLVASRCRSWGSSRFGHQPAVASLLSPSSRRLHPSKDSPRAQPVRVSTACCLLDVDLVALLAPPGFALPLPPFCAPPASKLDSKALLCGESVPRHAVSDATWAYPPLGFYVPFKILALALPGRMPVSRDGRPDRLRGAVSVPTVPAPTGAAAAPLSNLPVRAVGRSRRSGVPLVAAIPRGLEPTHAATPLAWGVTCIAGEPHHH